MTRQGRWREMVVILIGMVLLVVANWRWPHAVTVYLLLGAIGPLLLVLPFWLFWGVHHGLRLRTRTRWRVETSEETLTIWERGRRLVKLHNSTIGPPALLEVLGKRAISVDRIKVNPPRVFDALFD